MTRFAGDALQKNRAQQASSYAFSNAYNGSRSLDRATSEVRSTNRRDRYAFTGYDSANPRVQQAEEQPSSYTAQTGGSTADRLATTTANRRQAELDAKNRALYGG